LESGRRLEAGAPPAEARFGEAGLDAERGEVSLAAAGRQRGAGQLEVLLEDGQVILGELPDLVVAALADLVLRLLDVLDVVLDLEIGIPPVELGALELRHCPELPLLGR
jgi:hypothetical protein